MLLINIFYFTKKTIHYLFLKKNKIDFLFFFIIPPFDPPFPFFIMLRSIFLLLLPVLLISCVVKADFDVTPNVEIRRQPLSMNALYVSSYQAFVSGGCSSDTPDADLFISITTGLEIPVTQGCKRVYFSNLSVKLENKDGFAYSDATLDDIANIGCNDDACSQKMTVTFHNTPCSMFLENDMNPTVTVRGDLVADYCYGSAESVIPLSDFALIQVSIETESGRNLRPMSTKEVRLRPNLVRVLYGNPYLDANDLGDINDVDYLVGNNGDTTSNATSNATFIQEGFDYTDRGGAGTFEYTSDIDDWFSAEGKDFFDNRMPYMKHFVTLSLVSDHSITDWFTEDEATVDPSLVKGIRCCVLDTPTLDPKDPSFVNPDFSLYPLFGYPTVSEDDGGCEYIPNSRCSVARHKSDDDDDGDPETTPCYKQCPENKRYTQYCTPRCAFLPHVYNFTSDTFLVPQYNLSAADIYTYTPGYFAVSGRMPKVGVTAWTVLTPIFQFSMIPLFAVAVGWTNYFGPRKSR